jgi:hypothetical protein
MGITVRDAQGRDITNFRPNPTKRIEYYCNGCKAVIQGPAGIADHLVAIDERCGPLQFKREVSRGEVF